ncbi:hypothetical protein GCM10028808_39080 [Spirosoma migulaei]
MVPIALMPPDRRAYTSFYDGYAPKLWGILLLANLPNSQSEEILTRTLTKAWSQRDIHTPTEKHFLGWLLGLACREGLPIDCLQDILKPNL